MISFDETMGAYVENKPKSNSSGFAAQQSWSCTSCSSGKKLNPASPFPFQNTLLALPIHHHHQSEPCMHIRFNWISEWTTSEGAVPYLAKDIELEWQAGTVHMRPAVLDNGLSGSTGPLAICNGETLLKHSHY